MENSLSKIYKKGLWDFYASAITMISILAIVVAFVIGSYDILKLAFPAFTLNSAMHEKYQSNESYTDFGVFKKDVPEEKLTYERTANYEKLLRMERKNAVQRLVKVTLAIVIVTILNGILVVTYRRKSR